MERTATTSAHVLMTKNLMETMKNYLYKAQAPLLWLTNYYASVLGKEVTMRQMWLIVQAQVAFLLAAFPAECPLALRAAFAIWFACMIRKCRKSGL